MNKSYYFVEGKIYKEKDIPEHFIQYGYFQKNKNNNVTLKVCGISRYKNHNYIFFPKGVNLDLLNKNSELKNITYLLFKSIIKYKDSVRLSDYENEWLGNNNSNIQYIEIITWLLKDYMEFGLFRSKHKQEKINGNGKVSWDKTIRRSFPYILNNEINYFDLVTEKETYTIDSTVSKIHQQVVNECISEFYWLFDIHTRLAPVELNIDIEIQCIFLQRQLKKTFSEREIKLIQSLLTYLTLKSNVNAVFTLVTPYFYLIWEDILKNIFRHDTKLDLFLPKPYWFIGNKKHYTNQIPDILIKQDNEVIIIDAKYYQISNGEKDKFPGWESIVKQLYYSLSFPKELLVSLNLFMMPEAMINSYKFVGYTSVDGKENQFGRILAYSLNIEYTFKKYVNNEDAEEILEEILLNAKEFLEKLPNENT